MHPKVLNASGFPGDRQVLQLLNQERSVILNSAGRRNVFDVQNDMHVSNEIKRKLRNRND